MRVRLSVQISDVEGYRSRLSVQFSRFSTATTAGERCDPIRFQLTYSFPIFIRQADWYITRRFEHFLHESSNVSFNLRTEGVSTTANCGLLASLCSGSSSVRYLVETEYISLPDAKHSGLAHFSFEHSGKYLHLNVRTKTRFS